MIAAKWDGPVDILDYSCGILIEPRDPAHLVAGTEKAIVTLANGRDRCARKGHAGRAKVLGEYTCTRRSNAWSKSVERP